MFRRFTLQLAHVKCDSRYIVGLVLVICTVAVYFTVYRFEFINYDDYHYVTENPWVRVGLSDYGARWAFTATRSMNWHPITWLSHMTDCELYGLNAGAHHLTNLFIHVLNVLLLFIVLFRMTGSLWRSGFVASLFAVHPLNIEAVAWISQRKSLLSTFFMFLTLWTYARYAEHPTIFRYIGLILIFMLGLMSKPMLVTLPIVLLLMDYWPLGRIQTDEEAVGRRTFRLVLEKTPLLALSAASCIITYQVQDSGGATTSLALIPLGVRIANAIVSYAAYVEKMFWPYPLAVLYPHPRSVQVLALVGSTLLLSLISVYATAKRRDRPFLMVGWLWFLGMLIPVIGIVQVGVQSMADRYAYVPLIGLFIMVAWDLDIWFRRWRLRPLFCGLIPAGILIYVGCTAVYQLRYWSDSITLYEHTLRITEKNFVIHHNLGSALTRMGRYAEALAHFEEAFRIEPNFHPARESLKNVRSAGLSDLSMVRREIAVAPDSPEPYVRLGNLFKRKGAFHEAMRQYERALERDTGYLPALEQLGIVHAMTGDYENAIAFFRKVAAAEPGRSDTYYLLAGVCARQKSVEDALYWLEKAGRIGPLDRKRLAADPNFDAIRDRKPFRALLHRSGDEGLY